jgi:ribose 1,5-bisphosphokinase PhnN
MIYNVPAKCSLNLPKGVVPLTPRQKRHLVRYKAHLRDLANKKVSRKRKRQRLNQKGRNLLSELLPPVLGVLGSLLL